MAYAHVLERHAEEAAELWPLRARAASAPHYTLTDLARLDTRIDAHLSGLGVSPKESRAILVKSELAHAGVAFARAAAALATKDSAGFARVLEALDARPELVPGVLGALAWLPLATTSWAVRALMHASCPPILRRFGLAAHIAHRSDPGVALDDALRATSAPLRATAIDGAGKLARADLLDEIREDMASESPSVRGAAAFSSALLGDPSAPDELWKGADVERPGGRDALTLALARMGHEEGLSRLQAWTKEDARARTAIVTAGLLGAPEALPFVLERLEVPELSRAAGEAFHRITGIGIAGPLKRPAPRPRSDAGPNDDPEDPRVEMDPDEHLAWPAVSAVRAAGSDWLRGAPTGERLLLGQPITVARCDAALARGTQRVRGSAAIERALLDGSQLVDVGRPAHRRGASRRSAGRP